MSLIDGALEDHRFFQMPVSCDDAHASLYLREIGISENLCNEFAQRFRPTARRAVSDDRGNVFRVKAVDVCHFVPKRQQSRDDRSSAGAED